MGKDKKNLLRLLPAAVLLAGLTIAAWLHTPQALSLAERRALAQRPSLTWESFSGGVFMDRFDRYAMDQFPGRETFRRIKALTQYRLMGQRDVNGIFLKDGTAVKMEDPLRSSSVQAVGDKLKAVAEQYFPTGRYFYAWVPDKGYFFREEGYPGPDYDRLSREMDSAMDFAQKIDLTAGLTVEDYYATDSHWRQEHLGEAAALLAEALEISLHEELTPVLAREDFSGVYAGQTALPLATEAMYYLTSPALEGCTLYNAETGKTTGLYDLEGLWGRDPYDLYLGGAAALQVIENPAGPEGRELVIFRDSFGSSLAPWLAAGYRRVTLVDLRYLSSGLLVDYLEDRGQDVLFLYSTGIWNNSTLLR